MKKQTSITQVKALRIEAGLTRKQLCVVADIPYRTLQDWERDIASAPGLIIKYLQLYIKCKQLLE